MNRRIAIIGDGAMGTLSALLFDAKGGHARMWSAFEEHAEAMRCEGENKRFFAGFRLPETLEVSTDPAFVCEGAEFVVLAVPAQFLRRVLEQVGPHLPDDVPHVAVTKGIERETLKRPSEVLQEVAGPRPHAQLSGPCLSREVANQLPATVVVASADPEVAITAQKVFTTPWFRVYTSGDVVGVELGGALKNVIAIAAGICDGLELGSNAKAALVTRGLVEITRLGTALGARPETFAGLAGLGDLVTTCGSTLSRNHKVGEAIGRGRSLDNVLQEMGRVQPEGVETTRSTVALAERHGVDMPITREVHDVLFRGKPAPDALVDLMSREAKPERSALEV